MGAATYQDAFAGTVEQSDYTQVYDFEYGTYGNGTTGVSGSYRNLVTAKVTERAFRFQGLSYANAHATDSQTVKDAAGNSWTVPFASSLRDGSTGSRVFEVYSCTVTRTRMSPLLWEVTVRTRDTEYYVNGVKYNLPNG